MYKRDGGMAVFLVLLLWPLATWPGSRPATGWIAPRTVLADSGRPFLIDTGTLMRAGRSLMLSFVAGPLSRNCEHAGVAYIRPGTGESEVLFSTDSVCTYRPSSLLRLLDGIYLTWVRYAGKLPDGFDRYQVVAARIENEQIAEPFVVADSLEKVVSFASCGGLGFVVGTQSYYGAPYLDSSFLFVVSGPGRIRRSPMPHGEWGMPSIWCTDSLHVYVVGWSGYTIHYTYSTDGGRTWQFPPPPERSARAQNMKILVAKDGREFLFWNEDNCGGMFPDALYGSTRAGGGEWEHPTMFYSVAGQCDEFPWVDDACFVPLRRGSYGVAVFWTTKIWDTPEDYFSFWKAGRWLPPQRLFADWLPDHSVAQCRVLAEPSGVIHLVGVVSAGDSGMALIYTRTTGPVTAVEESASGAKAAAEEIRLLVRPNPFNASARLEFALKNSGDTRLSLFNTQGQLVRRLVNGWQQAGEHTVRWDGRDDAGRPLPSGVYLVRLEAGGQVATRKVVLVR